MAHLFLINTKFVFDTTYIKLSLNSSVDLVLIRLLWNWVTFRHAASSTCVFVRPSGITVSSLSAYTAPRNSCFTHWLKCFKIYFSLPFTIESLTCKHIINVVRVRHLLFVIDQGKILEHPVVEVKANNNCSLIYNSAFD